MSDVSAPLFKFGDIGTLAPDRLTGMSFTMTGPGATAEAGHLPVRGDLAHVRLAGRYFVPHYAVPMPMTVTAPGTLLLKSEKPDSDVLAELQPGALFNMLDISGGWAWGQVGEDGLVGYLPIAALTDPAGGSGTAP